jgi:prepilin-type N-terminal cleavage/methylation domain-containing protein
MARARTAGFTLVELMIVIGIIVLLVAVMAVALSGVFSKSEEAQTKATIETLKANIESYKTRWGQAPPTTLRDLGQLMGAPSIGDPNETNVGIETLVIALRSRREQGPYLDGPLFADDTRRVNLDIDTLIDGAFAPTALDIEDATARDLFEIVDAWGVSATASPRPTAARSRSSPSRPRTSCATPPPAATRPTTYSGASAKTASTSTAAATTSPVGKNTQSSAESRRTAPRC